jgi:teichuronic acid biosynthesis glycosyltransferase TuaG
MNFRIDISVITPAYNTEKFINRIYNSLKQQKYKYFEWIIIDDCSNDRTLALIQEFIHESILNIKLLKNNTNLGIAESRNKGLNIAKGEYICFLDADDFWLKDKLSVQLDYMKKNNILISYMDYKHVDSNGIPIKVITPPTQCTREMILKSNCIGTLTCMIKKELIYKNRFIKHGHEDYILWLELLSKTPKAYKVNTTFPLCNYTVSRNSVSGKKLKAATWQWSIYRNILNFSLIKSIYYFTFYIINGILKHK